MKLAKVTTEMIELAAEQSFQCLYDTFHGLKVDSKRQLLSDAKKILRSSSLGDEGLRVAYSRLLVSSVSETEPLIVSILSDYRRALSYECHFSLFCWLDALLSLPSLTNAEADFVSRVPDIVGRYLHTVPRNTALSAWMAGDLLGDHWLVAPALPVLLNSVLTARFVAGRKGAIHGLEKIYRRCTPDERKLILSVLAVVCRIDRSENVRMKVSYTMSLLRNGEESELPY